MSDRFYRVITDLVDTDDVSELEERKKRFDRNRDFVVVGLIINTVLAYYLFKFTVINPDEGECWASSYGLREASPEGTNEFDINVSN